MTLGLSIPPVPLAAHSIGVRQRGWGPNLGDHIHPQSPSACAAAQPQLRDASLGRTFTAIPLRCAQGLRAGQGCQTFGAAGRRRAQEGARTLSPNCAPFPPTQGKARPGSAEPPGSLRWSLCSGFPTRPPNKCPSCPLPPRSPSSPSHTAAPACPAEAMINFQQWHYRQS